MTFPVYRSRQDLELLLASGAVENTELEFKDSRALAREEGKMTELCINVSALANSNGGQIIYGINENKKSDGPRVVDEGVIDAAITRDWISQILNARIKPRLTEYSIDPIDLHQGQLGFVISVPQTSIGPHQAPDFRYYRRIGVEVRAMEDYEVRDIMRRATTPDLEVLLSFGGGRTTAVADFTQLQDVSKPFLLECTVINRSAAPAFHAIVELLVDNDLRIAFSNANFVQVRTEQNRTGQTFRVHRRTINSPPFTPIFKEAVHDTHTDSIGLQLPQSLRNSSFIYLETSVLCPGFSKREEWYINCKEGRMQLHRAPER
jgi:hypothetical protein